MMPMMHQQLHFRTNYKIEKTFDLLIIILDNVLSYVLVSTIRQFCYFSISFFNGIVGSLRLHTTKILHKYHLSSCVTSHLVTLSGNFKYRNRIDLTYLRGPEKFTDVIARFFVQDDVCRCIYCIVLMFLLLATIPSRDVYMISLASTGKEQIHVNGIIINNIILDIYIHTL